MNDFLTDLNLILIFGYLWQVIKNWWWLPLPFYLYPRLIYQYQWLIQGTWDNKIKKVFLEIKLPKEIKKPIKAMEQIFADFHALHDAPNWREKWLEGQFQLALSLEIVSQGGKIHFYIRTPEMFKNFIISNVQAQYPEAEISTVEDYAKLVPADIPNKDWDIWGTDYVNVKDEIYPIKTYPEFEDEKETKEERITDPLANLLEGMADLKPGEQMWYQIIIRPVLGRDFPWQKKGKELVDKLARRPEKEKSKSIPQQVYDLLFLAKAPGKTVEKEPDIIPPEMKLTPGEREVLAAVEGKLSKFGYKCNSRVIYLGKRDIFFKPKVKTFVGFFKTISTENLGGLRPWSKTTTKSKSVLFWFLDERILYFRQRRLFRNYKMRVAPLFPRPGGTFVLNTEELATMYHFPGETVVPTVGISRVETKKGVAPLELPTD